MLAATFRCLSCKVIFQLVGISTSNNKNSKANYCPYCGKDSIETTNIILC